MTPAIRNNFSALRRRSLAVAAFSALVACVPLAAFAERVPREHENPMWRLQNGLPLEYEDDAPMDPPWAGGLGTTRAAASITFGPYTSIQVNVNVLGNDIVGDAANEPSIAVSPFNHNIMCVGWRQFANVASNFREAGFGYTTNGGATWIAGKINPGTFRSDPVLAVDSGGDFFYNSLVQTLTSNIFVSSNGGQTWGNPIYAYGGDKQWMTVDRSIDNFYQAWSIASNPFAPNTFNKSPDDAATWNTPSQIPDAPIWGTLDVALDHTLYVGGWATNSSGQLTNMAVARSTDAHINDASPPVFTTTTVDLGGVLNTGGPNPVGLLGQVWCEVDKSNGPRSGWVYVLASVVTPTDPMDVMFIRSSDGGQTWSPPRRVNDDPGGNTRKYQWFGTMSVSPSGRIDAVWNDTRGSADSTISALYYSYSADGGTTWSPNVQVTPTWSSIVGWPNQQKIGDYYDTVSDDTGVDVAYAATFTGGQNVYYLRIPNTVTGIPPAIVGGLRLASSPNPFSRGTTIQFDAPVAGGHVRLEVFDLAGHRVTTLVDGFHTGASQSIGWDGRRTDGSQTPAGIYLCRLTAGGATETRKLLRVR